MSNSQYVQWLELNSRLSAVIGKKNKKENERVKTLVTILVLHAKINIQYSRVMVNGQLSLHHGLWPLSLGVPIMKTYTKSIESGKPF